MPNFGGKVLKFSKLSPPEETGVSKATLDDLYSAMGIGLKRRFFSGEGLLRQSSSSLSKAANSSSKSLVALGLTCLIIGGTGLDLMY